MYRRTFMTYAIAGTATVSTFSFANRAIAQDYEVKQMSLGNPDANVVVTEFAAFTCPHCASFHAQIFPKLKAEYIDTCKIKFVNNEVYFDRVGLWAGMLARCGGPDKYFGIVDLLFKRQREWRGDQNTPASVIIDNLKKIGKVAGLSDDTMDTCFTNQAMAEALVEEYQNTTGKVDWPRNQISTPTILINGEVEENYAFENLKAVIDAKLQETGSAEQSTDACNGGTSS